MTTIYGTEGGWSVVAGDGLYGAVDLSGLSNAQHRLLADRKAMWPAGERQIVTESVAQHLDLAGTDVVIWAGGGQHLPPIPRRWLFRPADSGRRVLVIDCNDRHHPLLANWTRQRRAAYDKARWFDEGVDPIVGRIERFLREPPRRQRLRQRSNNER